MPLRAWEDTGRCVECQGPVVPFSSDPSAGDVRHIKCAACGRDWVEADPVILARVWWSQGAWHEQRQRDGKQWPSIVDTLRVALEVESRIGSQRGVAVLYALLLASREVRNEDQPFWRLVHASITRRWSKLSALDRIKKDAWNLRETVAQALRAES